MLSKYEKSLITCFFLVALMAGFFFYSNFKNNQEIKKIELQIQIEKQKKISEINEKINALSLEAKAVSVYDIDSRQFIYGKNEDVALPLASLVKTMTILISLQNLPLDTIIEISPDAINQDGNFYLSVDEKWKLDDLAKFTLISSSNDGAYAIAKNVPSVVSKMNEKAKMIGMNDTSFLNSTGLDIDGEKAGAYASAKDANIMAAYALEAYPEIFNTTNLSKITFKSESGFVHKIENTDVLVDKIPNLLFSKTGFTSLAGGNLTIIFKNKEGHKIAITVLGSTQNGRFLDMEKLINVL